MIGHGEVPSSLGVSVDCGSQSFKRIASRLTERVVTFALFLRASFATDATDAADAADMDMSIQPQHQVTGSVPCILFRALLTNESHTRYTSLHSSGSTLFAKERCPNEVCDFLSYTVENKD